MKQCKAITRNETHCSKRAIGFSKYCLLHQDPSSWIYGIVFGAIISFSLTYWGIYHSINIKHEIEQQEKVDKKPQIDITLIELNDSIIQFTVKSFDKNLIPIDNLFFKFDIPGEYVSQTGKFKERIESYSILNSFLAGIDNETICETIHCQFNNILTEGFFRINIIYRPTQPLPIKGRDLLKRKDYPTHYIPIMDLHDYSRIFYTWTFNGETQTEINYLDLSHLEYIRKDNEEMIRQIDWFHDDESIKKMEEKRKNW